jgi:replicative DNA helicase
LDADLWENPYHSRLVKLIQEFFVQYREPPTKDILKEMVKERAKNPTDLGLISQQVELVFDKSVTPQETQFMKDSLDRFITQQIYRQKLLESIDFLGEGEFGKINAAIQEALRLTSRMDDVGIDFFTSLTSRLSDYDRESEFRVPTLVKGLDMALRGGLGRGELGVILGAAGIGKSICLANFEFAALVSGKVVFDYSLEMSELERARRLDTRMTGVSSEELLNQAEVIQRKLKKLERMRGKLFIKQFPTKQASVNNLKAHINKMQAELGIRPGFIGVDYGAIMKPVRTYEEKRFELSSIYEDLRGLAVELNVPIWSPAQTNRAALNKPIVDKDDIAECWDIVATADIIIAICQTKEEEQKDEARLFLAKNRIGQSSSIIPVKIEKRKMLVRDCSGGRLHPVAPKPIQHNQPVQE